MTLDQVRALKAKLMGELRESEMATAKTLGIDDDGSLWAPRNNVGALSGLVGGACAFGPVGAFIGWLVGGGVDIYWRRREHVAGLAGMPRPS